MILCVGGTPAMQRTLFFDRLDVGEVNRAREVRVTASGKVTNATRAVNVLGGPAPDLPCSRGYGSSGSLSF